MAGAVGPALISAPTLPPLGRPPAVPGKPEYGRECSEPQELKEGKIASNFKNWASSIAESHILT